MNISSWLITQRKFEYEFDDENRCLKLRRNIPGVPYDKVKLEKLWLNRTQQLFIALTVEENGTTKRTLIPVDTDNYERCSYDVTDGVLTITVYEVPHEEPLFFLY